MNRNYDVAYAYYERRIIFYLWLIQHHTHSAPQISVKTLILNRLANVFWSNRI
jgi:hypothetical protein